jgi:hypothetical protein
MSRDRSKALLLCMRAMLRAFAPEGVYDRTPSAVSIPQISKHRIDAF